MLFLIFPNSMPVQSYLLHCKFTSLMLLYTNTHIYIIHITQYIIFFLGLPKLIMFSNVGSLMQFMFDLLKSHHDPRIRLKQITVFFKPNIVHNFWYRTYGKWKHHIKSEFLDIIYLCFSSFRVPPWKLKNKCNFTIWIPAGKSIAIEIYICS